MNLHRKQLLFPQLFWRFERWLEDHGYERKYGDAKRSEEQAKWNAERGLGIEKSLHILLIAKDLEFYYQGEWLRGDNPDHEHHFRKIAEHWVDMHPLCRAGYYFKDPYHFSLEHEGRK